jgi:putative hydrolase of the HAD superfamily
MLNMDNKLKGIKHIWWDLDDTLYPFNPAYDRKKKEAMISEYARLKRINFKSAKVLFERDLHKYGSSGKLFSNIFGKLAGYGQMMQNKVDRRPFIKKNKQMERFFKDFKRRFPDIKHSILSNSMKDQILLTLKLIGLDKKHFSNISSTVDLNAPKPDIRVYRKIISLSRLKPREIMYIGDRENVDIVPAKKVGMVAVLLSKKNVETRADYVVKRVSEVMNLFV